ncbi:hypothetical protein MRX96_042376 [Rhipicephalus microplus]
MPVPNRRQRLHVKGQKARSRAASTGSCGTPRGTPPYSGQRPQRPETRSDITEDPLPEGCRALVLSDLSRLLPVPDGVQARRDNARHRRVRHPGVIATFVNYDRGNDVQC